MLLIFTTPLIFNLFSILIIILLFTIKSTTFCNYF
nr:MAG TPA: hypothetical protein [Caudoviricetes sp.]